MRFRFNRAPGTQRAIGEMTMREFFITARSFAAPFFSDTSEGFIEGDSPADSLERWAKTYSHPCGLYAAGCYENADAFHKGSKPLAQWLSNHARAVQRATTGKSSYSYFSHGPGKFEINRELHKIADPKSGSVVILGA